MVAPITDDELARLEAGLVDVHPWAPIAVEAQRIAAMVDAVREARARAKKAEEERDGDAVSIPLDDPADPPAVRVSGSLNAVDCRSEWRVVDEMAKRLALVAHELAQLREQVADLEARLTHRR